MLVKGRERATGPTTFLLGPLAFRDVKARVRTQGEAGSARCHASPPPTLAQGLRPLRPPSLIQCHCPAGLGGSSSEVVAGAGEHNCAKALRPAVGLLRTQ